MAPRGSCSPRRGVTPAGVPTSPGATARELAPTASFDSEITDPPSGQGTEAELIGGGPLALPFRGRALLLGSHVPQL